MLEIKWRFRVQHLVHLIPLFLSWTYWGYVFFSGENSLKLVLQNREKGIYPWQLESFQIIIILQAVIYLGYSFRLIRKKQNVASSAQLPRIRFQWLKQFILVLIGLIFLLIVFSFLVKPVIIDYIIAPILYGISNVFLVYKGLNSSGILTDTAKERYTGSNLKQEQVEEYKSLLLKYLKTDEPFTNPELTLSDLSEKTNIPTHHLSQIINQEFGKNFFDLINSYRIEKSKSLLKDSKTANLTLEAIGLQSGFGSSSSFYRAFKKHTGITPNAFLKSQDKGVFIE